MLAITILMVTSHQIHAGSNPKTTSTQSNQPSSSSKLIVVQKNALDLVREFQSLEESLIFPENNLLVVFMQQDFGAQLLLRKIDFYLDNRLIESYFYQEMDLEKLMDRGVLRVASLLVTPGEHIIAIEIHSINRQPLKNELRLTKYSKPQFVSLNLSGSKMLLKEWEGF